MRDKTAQLELVFANNRLTKTSFRTSDTAEWLKASSSSDNNSKITWSGGCAAFCLLALETLRTHYLGQPNAETHLYGNKDSFASVLDHSIAKSNVSWLRAILGDLTNRVLKVDNSEGRRNKREAITIKIASNILPPENIVIRSDDVALVSAEDVEKLITAIKCDHIRYTAHFRLLTPGADIEDVSTPQETSSALNGCLTNAFREAFTNEVTTLLKTTNVFCPHWARSAQAVLNQPMIVPDTLSSRSRSSIQQIEAILNTRRPSNAPDSLLRRNLGHYSCLRCAIPADLVASVVVMANLRAKGIVPVTLEYEFSHSPDIVNFISNGALDVDLVILSVAPAIAFLSNPIAKNYQPILPMPGLTRHLIQLPNCGIPKVVLCMKDTASTSFHFSRELIADGKNIHQRVKLEYSEPQSSTVRLTDGDKDAAAVFVFPHNIFHSHHTGAVPIPVGHHLTNTQTYLFAKKATFATDVALTALSTAVILAWTELNESPRALGHVVDSLLADRRFLRALTRASGFYNNY